MKKGKRIHLLSPAIVLAILAGSVIEASSRPKASDAEPYHANVRAAGANLPLVIRGEDGEWNGGDEPVPLAAFKLLKPNIIVSRRFVNLKTHHSVGVLIVH